MDAAVGKLVVFSARIETCASEERSASAPEPARPHANDASANTASARAYHRAHSAPAAEDEMSGNTASGRNATAAEPTSSTYAFTRRSQRSLDAFAASGWERASPGEARVAPERPPADAARAPESASREGAGFQTTALPGRDEACVPAPVGTDRGSDLARRAAAGGEADARRRDIANATNPRVVAVASEAGGMVAADRARARDDVVDTRFISVVIFAEG